MISFVVLHYNDYNITVECVNHLLCLNDQANITIYVVDNGSPNQSGKRIKELYSDEPKVIVILSDENLGFAKGNNLGYVEAKKNNPDFIVVMNNDVIIEQQDFIERLINMPRNKEYEVIMPDIVNKIGVHQNPFRLKPLSNSEVRKNYLKILFLNFVYHCPIVNSIWCNRKKRSNIQNTQRNLSFSNFEMMVPHGACVIYSQKWIEKEQVAFVPDTFLYGEEDILYEYIVNRNYKTIFAPGLSVKHFEDVATGSVIKSDLKKAQFLFRNSLRSQKVFLRIRRQNNKGMHYSIEDEH